MAFLPAASGVVDEDWEPPKANHIGPIDGLNFMSLNMTDDELQDIQGAIVKLFPAKTTEAALATICREWAANCEWAESRR